MDVLFLDANVLFSAAYRPGAGLRRLWTLEDAELISSAYAIDEARRNLRETKRRDRLQGLLASVRLVASLPRLELPDGIELPEKDHPILLAALAARATHLITGDYSDFGSLFGHEVEGVMILPPGAYLRTRDERRADPT